MGRPEEYDLVPPLPVMDDGGHSEPCFQILPPASALSVMAPILGGTIRHVCWGLGVVKAQDLGYMGESKEAGWTPSSPEPVFTPFWHFHCGTFCALGKLDFQNHIPSLPPIWGLEAGVAIPHLDGILFRTDLQER